MSEENQIPDPAELAAIEFEKANNTFDHRLKAIKKELSSAKNEKAQPSGNVTANEIKNNAQNRKERKDEIESLEIRLERAECNLNKASENQLQKARETVLMLKKNLCAVYMKLIELEREHAQKYSVASICGEIADSLDDIADAFS